MKPFARALVALLGLVLTSAAVPPSTLASTANARQSSSTSGNCCSPSQVARAEARLPARPLNPQALVQSVTRLKLVNFEVSTSGHMLAGHPRGVNTIQYFFGYMPPTAGNLFVRRRPRFVVVTEIVEQLASRGISITPVFTGIHFTPIPRGYYSPLVLVAPLPQRDLTFAIESNIPRSRLRLLGESLLAAAANQGCLVTSHLSWFTCNAPKYLVQAENQLSRRPVSPVAVVAGLAHLPLIQVIVFGSRAGHARSISYIFERHHRNLGDVPGIDVRGQPPFVEVDEFTFATSPSRPTFGRNCQAPTICSNWQFHAGLPGRHLALLVTSNLPPQQVHGIGNALMTNGAHGK